MSEKYPGGFITKNAPQPTGGESGSAPGIWTLDQALQYTKAGTWPLQPLPNYIENVFSTYLYKGNGSTQTITNGIDLSSKGGMVWIKDRNSGVYWHCVYDTNRGATKQIYTNRTELQDTEATSITAFNNNGFSLGSYIATNENAQNLVSWTFRKQAKFFDVVTYSGNSVAGRQISHNLGSVPGVMIVKVISGTANDWQVYHRSLGNTKYLRLNTTDTPSTATSRWNDTDPTSTYFVVGNNSSVNATGSDYVAYLFAHDAGGFGLNGTDNVISCGSYTGNGSATGPTITLGYEPQWLLVKSTTAVGSHWYLMDTTRVMSFNNAWELYPNLSASDTAQAKNIVPTATGFQVVTTDGYLNTNGGTYVYIAIRRGPMKTATSGTQIFDPETSNGAIGTVLTTGFPLDLQIVHARDAIDNVYWMDRLRGLNSLAGDKNNGYIYSSLNAAQTTTTGLTNYVDNTGFQISGAFSGILNVYWNFRRAPGAFDIVSYLGNNPSGGTTTQNVTHNLGVAPELMIVKNLSATGDWYVYSSALGPSVYLRLQTTGTTASSTTVWNNTNPTSSVFSVGATSATNNDTNRYIAYLFASLSGVCKVGTYTGTGASQTIDCGFTGGARFIMIKRTNTATGNWYVWDSARGISSGNDPFVFMNATSTEETTFNYVDTTSVGFTLTASAPAAINASGSTFLFLAIA